MGLLRPFKFDEFVEVADSALCGSVAVFGCP